MANFTDGYGYTITDNGNGTWSRTESDGAHTFTGSQNQALANFSSLQPVGYVPKPQPQPPVTVISAAALLARLTQAEALGIQTAALTNASVALWLETLNLNGTANSLDPLFQQGLGAFVAAGLLTQARATQIGNFNVTSP